MERDLGDHLVQSPHFTEETKAQKVTQDHGYKGKIKARKKPFRLPFNLRVFLIPLNNCEKEVVQRCPVKTLKDYDVKKGYFP